ncbi:protein draper-like isoform X2 [Paramacrobiotus metropolitanus]|uniref:protein draper-like isoform X2 n=1 Tax=Paramacrobiotus metropolitanus TaxID=2943436 RepID=UPI002445E51D|nr:protein draper-like isoform X2 [Paramacrobiotus metropolitanus]
MRLPTLSVFLISLAGMHYCIELDPNSPNICEKQEIVQEETMVPTREPTQVATKTWCLSIPPRCTTYKTVYKVVYKKNVNAVPKMVKKCCDGYTLHSNGTCIQCPAGKWGQQCQKDCACRNGAICDAINGRCECTDGWQGAACDQPCPVGHYGKMCLQQCRCENGAQCDPVSGGCKCPDGFCGPLCEKSCAPTKIETVCDRCQNGGVCEAGADKCSCPAGYTGEVCANQCDSGFYGKDCKKQCRACYNEGKCDPISGGCKCPAGYWGPQCEKQCEPGQYGPNCQSLCNCDNAQTCDPVSGKCRCYSGFTGDRCDQRACPDGKFGKFCNNTCTCSNLTVCHPFDGACMCQPHADRLGGPACSICCILQGKDADCYKNCNTNDKWVCAPELDGCVCLPGYVGKECRVSLSVNGDDASNAALRSSQVVVSQSDNTGLIVGLCIAVIVLALILVMLVFYRRRVRKLQTELASVGYTSSGTDSDLSDSRTDLNRADNFMYLNNGTGPGKTPTSVNFKNGETFVKVAEPLKKPLGNMYVAMPKPKETNPYDISDDGIYQSVDYEVPSGKHQYASIEGDYNASTASTSVGQTNHAFENQLYNHKQDMYGRAPPSYDTVITETAMSSKPS